MLTHRLGLRLVECSTKGYRKQLVGPNQPRQFQTKYHAQNTVNPSFWVCAVFRDKLVPGHQHEYVWVEGSKIIEIALEMQWESLANFMLCLFTFSCPKRIARIAMGFFICTGQLSLFITPFFNIMRLQPHTS